MQNNQSNEKTGTRLFEVFYATDKEIHRMYITNDLDKLKKKIKESFRLRYGVKNIYYYDNNDKNGERICMSTEEDYEIMLGFNANQKIIYLYFDWCCCSH